MAVSRAVPSEELNRQFEYITEVKKLLIEKFGGQSPKAFTHTYGCQGNVADGERIDGLLEQMGYEFTEDPSEADFVLFNTCAVREHAEDRVFGNVGRLKKFKETNPNLIICLCGCMVQQEHVLKRIKQSFPYVDLAFGTHVLYKLPEFMFRLLTDGGRVFDITDDDTDIAEGITSRYTNSIKAFLPISYGCNNFCTYCVVPHVKGRERSRDYKDIIADAEKLVAAGYKEIMLLGQNVNSYGNDFGEQNLFPKLLRDINDIPGEFIIRFMSSHPKDCSRELLDTMAECEKVEGHLHLPFQSGNDRVLKAMNRRYTREHYLDIVNYAKEIMPDLCITSDVIVGFPGETHEEFMDTLSLIEEVGYSALYTFIYSPRVGTPGAEMPDPVSKTEKQMWFEQLMRTQERVAAENSAKLKGQCFKVLAESRNKNGKLQGRTSGNIMVEFDGPDNKIGTFVNVEITDPLTFVLKGKII